jgi:hypothetical protein
MRYRTVHVMSMSCIGAGVWMAVAIGAGILQAASPRHVNEGSEQTNCRWIGH